ncbi:serine/threonine protein kinase [Nocardia zapadnayensis]|uniref:serine/threonine-protein kinase n=1 Tax=Nocardia rhamnosiphila TaxID=426716 RepID=UPI002247136D|nr:serine/threonine-protein kinase [Nocardia zapadnayensis]MCX0274624.1 serine/threonine protein kinase [Nocardia zapadnayensis]
MLGVGAVFAGYQIQGVLGQGGMGTVYLAQHPRLPRQVALKLLNREVSTDPELVRRFEREADVVARLDHPGIVGVLDRGADNGHLWIAMHYIHGTDAASWDGSAHPAAMTVRLLAGVGSALDYAHSRGILHRDVKPANILVVAADDFREAQAVITDFGIAGVIDSTDTKITATGTFTATLAYASPEQLSGEAVDHRSDQYSLACTLYAMLAGRPPFASTNPGQVVTSHLSKPVPRLTAIRPDLPAALDAVLTRAMAKQRQDRFSTCTEFTTAARAVLENPVAATVNFARTAPTVHNSTPLGNGHRAQPTLEMSAPHPAPTTRDPVPYTSVAPYPGRSNPIGHSIPAPRTKFPLILAAAVAVFVVVLIGTATVAYLSNSTAGGDPSTPAWGDHQYMRDEFPGLVPERDLERGWKQVSCYTGYHAKRNEIECHHHDDSGISFAIEDNFTPSAVQERLNSNEFRYQEFPPRPDNLHTSDTRPAPNPTLRASAQMTVPAEHSEATIYAAAYFSFPTDPVRGRYLITVEWPGHTADDILRDWWSQAPLDR